MPPTESTTEMLNVDVPAVVGTPLITPVVVFSASAAGNVPVATDHVYPVPLPPEAISVWEYATLTTPAGSVAGEIATGAAAAVATQRQAKRNL